MTEDQHILLKLMEECDEVSQRCSKQIQFGKTEQQVGQLLTNGERLRNEVLDLLSVVSIIQDRELIQNITPKQLKLAKKQKLAKINKYLTYSKSLGMVNAS